MRPEPTFGGTCLALLLAGAGVGEVQQAPLLGHFLYHAQVLVDEGTTVRRLDVDVTGDGVPELLLAQGDRIPSWFIYEKTGQATYRFLGNLSFIAQHFRADQDPLRVVVSLPNPGGIWRTVVFRYRQGNPPFEECLPRGSAECGDTKEDFAKWRKRSGVRQTHARVVDLESSDDPEWVDSQTVEPVAGLGGLRSLVVR